jgi:hypothetical protein
MRVEVEVQREVQGGVALAGFHYQHQQHAVDCRWQAQHNTS